MVDVELLVASGAPRDVFSMTPAAPSARWPTWRLDDAKLRAFGWIVADGHCYLPDSVADIEVPHPYDLGPAWDGANSWRATFTLRTHETAVAFVDHEACGAERLACNAGPPLASGSPWRWRVDGLPGGVRCGRAETPVAAAILVEAVVVEAGSEQFVGTPTRRTHRRP